MLKFSAVQPIAKMPRQSAQEPATSAQIYFSIQLPACSMEAINYNPVFSVRPPFSSRRLRAQELIEIGLHHTTDLTVFICLCGPYTFQHLQEVMINADQLSNALVLPRSGYTEPEDSFCLQYAAIRRLVIRKPHFFDGLAPTPALLENGSRATPASSTGSGCLNDLRIQIITPNIHTHRIVHHLLASSIASYQHLRGMIWLPVL